MRCRFSTGLSRNGATAGRSSLRDMTGAFVLGKPRGYVKSVTPGYFQVKDDVCVRGVTCEREGGRVHFLRTRRTSSIGRTMKNGGRDTTPPPTQGRPGLRAGHGEGPADQVEPIGCVQLTADRIKP